ncbi:ABC transporter substrate-binding protein [Afifella sp. IM 167]|uniref:ABC transporter substrate-binding protein n=1 Tax=Afifella sp. IM 167 TaxID=2033586 RepID=UPI001CCF7C7A|nr:ABC transporter substrate-binding protein [Afifella sp. IM 167]MBZ8135129.1 ABC transporter substrate-binding protein [Afifella sp. IM 167]
MTKTKITRRAVLQGISVSTAALAMPAVWRPARAAQSLVISDPGGVYTRAWTAAYYEPFAKETGIDIVPVVRRSNPSAEFKAQVETGNYNWDVSGGVNSDVADLVASQGLTEPLDLSGEAMGQIPDDMKSEHYLADSIVTFVLAYRTDAFPNGLTSFADIWDLEAYPGRRALRRLARDTVEIALRADGVPGGDEIYQVLSTEDGWKRAFAKLDEIKPHVQVWWDSSPQSAQLLQNGEVDICPAFNARAQSAADAGAPVDINWNQGFYSATGWCIPKGTPKADLAREFVKFCANPERQAAVTEMLPNGPSNPKAYDFIPEKTAKMLPTYPANFKQTKPVNGAFWSDHKAEADRRFTEWLLQG